VKPLRAPDRMSTLESKPQIASLAKFFFLSLAVGIASLLAIAAFVIFILVPEDVRNAILREPLFPW